MALSLKPLRRLFCLQAAQENGDLHEVAIAKFIVKWFNDKPHVKVKTQALQVFQRKLNC